MDIERPVTRPVGLHEPGMVVGGYTLVRRLDRGGMAEVWIAKSLGSGRAEKHVALKFIAPHLADDKRYRRLFRAEAEVAMMLNHANIVQTFDFDESHEIPYLAMEWVDGINLRKVRDSLAAVSEDRRVLIACYVLEQLLHALRYAHSIVTHHGEKVRLVHRDVTPQNVLISNSAEVKLTDFGVAATSLDETSGLHVKGKVRYMAPEQISGHSREKTVDLYAAGTIFHELLEGERFRGEIQGDRELYVEVLEGEIPETSCDLPDALEDLRCGLLEPDPEHRIQSADEALDLLCAVPRVGDPRRDLMRLCTGLTGIVVPRSGPGQSSIHGMARPTRGTRRTASRRPKRLVSVAPPPQAEAEIPRDDEAESDGKRQGTHDARDAVSRIPRLDSLDPPHEAKNLPIEVSATEQLSNGVLLETGPSDNTHAATADARQHDDANNSGRHHPKRMRTLPVLYPEWSPSVAGSVASSRPSPGSSIPVAPAPSTPITIDPHPVGRGAALHSKAERHSSPPRPLGLSLVFVSAIVLVATTAIVTWQLANPVIESEASPGVTTPVDKIAEHSGAPPSHPPKVASTHDIAVNDAKVHLHAKSDQNNEPTRAVEAQENSTAHDTPVTGKDEPIRKEIGAAAPTNDDHVTRSATVEPRPSLSSPPRTPTMTIRVARKQNTRPQWVWTGRRSAPYHIDSPPYRIINKVPENSYIYWNTAKTKKGAKKQKIGKRKRKKIWNLVITPTGTTELYLDE